MRTTIATRLAIGLLLTACDDNTSHPSIDADPTTSSGADTTSSPDSSAPDSSAPDSSADTATSEDSSATTVEDSSTPADSSEPVDTTVAETSPSDTAVSACSGGSVVFTWGSPVNTVTDTAGSFEAHTTDGSNRGATFACPDDWFADSTIDDLVGVPVSIVWEHTKVAADPWNDYAAAFTSADTVYDAMYISFGARLDGTFTVTSSTGATKSYVVKYLEPVTSLGVSDTREAYAFLANLSRNAGPHATIIGVGQDLRLERMRVKFEGAADWTPWIYGDVHWDPNYVPQGGAAGDIEVINTCYPDGYLYHYQSNAFADWQAHSEEKKDGSFVFLDNNSGEINGINTFGIHPTSMMPAWQSCQVDYTFRFHADLIANR